VPLNTVDASVYYWDGKEEHRVKADSKGNRVRNLLTKHQVITQNRTRMKEPIYIGELHYTTKRRLSDGRSSTLLTKDLKDILSSHSKLMPMWDRGHAFVGGLYSGSSMHVDQTLWSNIGKNWTGYKILFVWEYGEPSLNVLEKFYKQIMKPPFSPEERKALQSASKVVLVGPGDVFCFSGGNAHMTIGVGDELSLTAYESFVNLHRRNITVFRQSGRKDHFEDCIMDESDLEDLFDDVVDNIYDVLKKYHQLQNIPTQLDTPKREDGERVFGREKEEIEADLKLRDLCISHIPSMLSELSKDSFFRRELQGLKRVKSLLNHLIRSARSDVAGIKAVSTRRRARALPLPPLHPNSPSGRGIWGMDQSAKADPPSQSVSHNDEESDPSTPILPPPKPSQPVSRKRKIHFDRGSRDSKRPLVSPEISK